jgi:hypothetical protein
MSRGTRIPDDFAPSPALIQYARDQGVVDTVRMLDDFCDFWRSKAGKDAVKMDWAATWRLWARKAGDKARELAAREQRYQQRYAPATGLVMAKDRNPRRFMQAVETKSPDAPLSAEQQRMIDDFKRRTGMERTAH